MSPFGDKKKLRGLVYCGSEACSADLHRLFFFFSSQMHPITVLNVITARSVRAVYWRCLSGESCPCPLLLWKTDIVSTGKWPAPAAVPPEMCYQATGQLWGLWGLYFWTARDCIFTFSSFLVFHSRFHSYDSLKGFFSIEKQHYYYDSCLLVHPSHTRQSYLSLLSWNLGHDPSLV